MSLLPAFEVGLADFAAVDSLVADAKPVGKPSNCGVYKKEQQVRLFRCFIALALSSSVSLADVVEVPFKPDGSVDINALNSSFTFKWGQADEPILFTGEMLESSVEGSIFGEIGFDGFELTINAPLLSEHAQFIVAVFLTDLVCHHKGHAPGVVLWQETAQQESGLLSVSTACSRTSEP